MNNNLFDSINNYLISKEIITDLIKIQKRPLILMVYGILFRDSFGLIKMSDLWHECLKF